ncbi:unnamed protein product, partial [Trichogramma brassicae]
MRLCRQKKDKESKEASVNLMSNCKITLVKLMISCQIKKSRLLRGHTLLASPPELSIRTRCLVPSCECGSRFCRRCCELDCRLVDGLGQRALYYLTLAEHKLKLRLHWYTAGARIGRLSFHTNFSFFFNSLCRGSNIFAFPVPMTGQLPLRDVLLDPWYISGYFLFKII